MVYIPMSLILFVPITYALNLAPKVKFADKKARRSPESSKVECIPFLTPPPNLHRVHAWDEKYYGACLD